ncbi:hypothetical protein H112_07059 [Trichophyton rubrum D6]|uniref:Elongator complex protein 6 n=4 Tax=Trichophyton TaxID=5550 RepID=A0A178F1Q8_TRIRU|nr:uncharacterized protein TERG_02398 [Trichophyton rubrum CBS 118892]EZF11831.1 hypothetical protein H100_07081 [Trichophyton rubrum MR850]EZF38726.1 hypothetical protein H102_07044 [Trichophyton rubrum CBS 100081]EZF49359.1 hypothetical protein H103_07065 [Trichophyton rubrum CBS 288.86]EZF59973.1 hypothetical protein H104_07020 [Trichophyton rubrum CBS 289.86]EZF70623.1 hypothetical protein H105_07079 [Trichophyton soudanense CBS 452.61]EZF81288.1 hypothetical protein H110_07061 [Trichophy
MSSATAPLLAPYTAPPPYQSLHLITSVLGSTSNWLVLRCLCDTLQIPLRRGGNIDGLEDTAGLERDDSVKRSKKRKVVLVSFLRGWEFWRAEARRVGLDLNKLSKEGRFSFVDGVTNLFSPSPALQTPKSVAPGEALAASTRARKSSISSPSFPLPDRTPPKSSSQVARAPKPGPISFSGRANPLLARPAPPTPPISSAPPTVFATPESSRNDNRHSQNIRMLRWAPSAGNSGGLDGVEKVITSAIADICKGQETPEQAGDNDVLLVLDQPDFLLASTGPSMQVGSTEMGELIMGLRRLVHSTIITVAADSPLMHSSQQPTPLEIEHSALVVSLAHQAQMVMQLRGLDTGVARDVSGVLRVSKGGALADTDTLKNGENDDTWEEKEVLYFVQSDGSVKVFGRGE